MDDITALFAEAIATLPDSLRPSARDVALFYTDGKFSAIAGNDCPSVMLGETGGMWHGDGATAAAALRELIADMRDNPNG